MPRKLGALMIGVFVAVAGVTVAATLTRTSSHGRTAPSSAAAREPAAPGALDRHLYPRTYHLYGPGPVDDLARYDMLVGFRSLDAANLRKRNPNGIFLLNPGIEGEDGYDSFGVTAPGPAVTWKGGRDRSPGGVDLGLIRPVDAEWDLLHNADGSTAAVSEYFDRLTGWNLAGPSGKGTPELVAKLFAYAAKVDGLYGCQVRIRGKRVGCWSGIHSDNWLYSAIGASWFYGSNLDADRDGTIDAETELRRNWANGLTHTGMLLRSYLPGLVVGGNGAWYQSDTYAGSDPKGWLDASNYTLMEDMQNFALDTPDAFLAIVKQWLGHRDPKGQPRYMAVLHQVTDPSGEPIVITEDTPNTERSMRRPDVMQSMRWGLTLSLMSDAYYGIYVAGGPFNAHSTLWWFDEFDGGQGVRKRGYLGKALGRYRKLSDGVYRRAFENGIVINNSSLQERTIALGGTYRKLRGEQNPELNDGSAVSSVVVPARDGIVLLRMGSS